MHFRNPKPPNGDESDLRPCASHLAYHYDELKRCVTGSVAGRRARDSRTAPGEFVGFILECVKSIVANEGS